MKLIGLMDRIDLGDRGCKGIIIDSEHLQIKLIIDDMAYLKEGSQDYNNAESIVNGKLVFEEVSYFELTPGMVFYEYIDIDSITDNNDGTYSLIFATFRYDKGEYVPISIKITCKKMHIETESGEKITE